MLLGHLLNTHRRITGLLAILSRTQVHKHGILTKLRCGLWEQPPPRPFGAELTDHPAINVVSASGAISPATYADGSTYQGSSGSSIAMHQVDFAVNITLSAGQTYDFFLDGTGSGDGTVVPFAHASNAALSGSPQDGADNSMLYAEVVSGILDPTSVGTWDSSTDGWDKSSDVNVQVSGAPASVPEPSTYFAGALLLLPLGVGAIRSLRKERTV